MDDFVEQDDLDADRVGLGMVDDLDLPAALTVLGPALDRARLQVVAGAHSEGDGVGVEVALDGTQAHEGVEGEGERGGLGHCADAAVEMTSAT